MRGIIEIKKMREIGGIRWIKKMRGIRKMMREMMKEMRRELIKEIKRDDKKNNNFEIMRKIKER